MENNFTLNELLQVYDLIYTLRSSTIPKNEHIDILACHEYWEQLNILLIRMGNTFKDQLVNKKSIEEITGKTIHTFEKVYDENDVLTAIKIVPVETVEFINVTFTIRPTGSIF